MRPFLLFLSHSAWLNHSEVQFWKFLKSLQNSKTGKGICPPKNHPSFSLISVQLHTYQCIQFYILYHGVYQNLNKWSHYNCIETFQMSEQETFFRSILIMPSEFFNSKDEKQNSVKKNNNKLIYIADMKKLLLILNVHKEYLQNMITKSWKLKHYPHTLTHVGCLRLELAKLRCVMESLFYTCSELSQIFIPSNDKEHRFTQVLRKLNTPLHSTIARHRWCQTRQRAPLSISPCMQVKS